jgi:hypothetical protein
VAKKDKPPAMPVGMVRMRHKEGIGCSFAGRSYDVDPDGTVSVPAAALAELAAHGFIAVEELPPA